MSTVKTVTDGNSKLTNEEKGILLARLMEIVRRSNEGTLDKKDVAEAMQAIVEGKARRMLTPCSQPHRSPPRKFKRSSPKDRHRSLSPIGARLPHSRERLKYDGIVRRRSRAGKRPPMHPENVMAVMWEAENIPQLSVNGGRVPVHTILDTGNPELRDLMVIASTLQWLGTSVGSEFLRRFIATANLSV